MKKEEVYSAFQSPHDTNKKKGFVICPSYLEPLKYKTNATPDQIVNILKHAGNFFQ